MSYRFILYGWLASIGSCSLAAVLEEPRELGWLWVSIVLAVYFSLVIALREYWQAISAAPQSAPARSRSRARTR